MLVLILGYVGFWAAFSFLLGFGLSVVVSPGLDKKSDGEDLTKAAFTVGALVSLAIVILIVTCRIIF